MQNHLLTILILLPVVGAATTIVYGLTPGAKESHYRWIALGFTTLAFFALAVANQRRRRKPQHVCPGRNYSWIGSVGARYHVGIDGISLWLVC